MFIVITGKPGVGKTTILNNLSQNGILTLEIDQYVKEIYKPNRIGYKLIMEKFGKEYVNNIGVDTKKLGDLILNKPHLMNKLNQLIWPIIYRYIERIKKKYDNLVVELGIYSADTAYFKDLFDFVVEVKNRNVKNKFDQFYNEKSVSADFTINNNWTIDYLLFVANQLFTLIY